MAGSLRWVEEGYRKPPPPPPGLSAGRTSVLLLHGELLLQGLPELPLPEQLHLQLRLLQLHLLLLSPRVVNGHLEESLRTSHTQTERANTHEYI